MEVITTPGTMATTRHPGRGAGDTILGTIIPVGVPRGHGHGDGVADGIILIPDIGQVTVHRGVGPVPPGGQVHRELRVLTL